MENLQQLTQSLVSRGGNTKEMKDLASKHIKYLERVYPDATLRQWCDVALTLG